MILINSSTRQFSIPGADLVFGVESDSGSEVKNFQCPRYVGNNLDIAGSFVRINYRNANGEIDSYLVKDVTVDGDNVLFGWELSPKVTTYKGNVSFVMCVVGPDTKVKWHTTLGRGQVLEGLEPESAMIEEGTADIVAALITMVEAQTEAVEAEGGKQIKAVQTAAQTAQSDAVAQIEAKGASTLATIPGEYTATVNAVQSAANAIRGKVSGEVIRVDDVSPMKHYPVVKVSGKNLIPFPYEQMEKTMGDGTLVALSDGGVQGSGIPTEFIGLNLCHNVLVAKGETVTMSSSGDGNGLSVQFTLTTTNGDPIKSFSLTSGESGTYVAREDTLVGVLVKRASNGVEMTGTIYAQLELGDTATEYTPYVDPTTVTVTRCGKNVLKPSGSKSQNGVTLTMDENGVYTISGTTTASINLNLGNMILKAGCKYKPTVHLYSGSIKPSFWSFAAQANMYTDKDGCLVSEADTKASSFIYASSAGSTYDAKFTIMVELVNDENTGDYELYDGEEQIPTVDGTVSGLRAVSPTMTLMTDTAGVNIECEYSRDTNKVIAEILEKITALGG